MSGVWNRFKRFAAPSLAFVLVAACGGGGGEDSPPQRPVSGPWHGVTSQGRTLAFTVNGAEITSVKLAYNVVGNSCSEKGSVTLSALTLGILENGSFLGQLQTPGPDPIRIASAGSFAGPDSASGSVTVSTRCGEATAKWTATPGPLPNSVPVANAGPDQNVTSGSTVTLDSSGSDDADNDLIRPRWVLQAPAGSTAQLSDATSARPTFPVDRAGTYVATLVVSDSQADSPADTVTVVAAAPQTDGTWSGVDSGGNAIRFVVANGGLTSLTLAYSIVGNFCTASGSSTTTFATPLPLGTSFTTTGRGAGPSAFSYTFAGTFDGERSASGMLDTSIVNSFPNPPCSGSNRTSWTASRQ